ncbi:hypothetical protein ABI59_09845 [Acidobacteria bacterium Mor1]|nr:hypothetical protein ABI59_09845 [Acidobacteria bacterium Mor1]
MRLKTLTLAIVLLALSASVAQADAPLAKRLELDTAQAGTVAEIQAKHRAEMRKERGALNRESRALRRARAANDSELVAKQEAVVAELQSKMAQRILAEDAEIRAVLNPEQQKKFDAWIEERNKMVGSSRDARVLKPAKKAD